MLGVLAAAAFGTSFGFGAGHGIFGPQLELRIEHLVLSGGVGLVDFPFSEYTNDPEGHVSPAAGVKWVFGDGEGAYVSVHVAYFSDTIRNSAIEFETRDRTVFGATAGWRLRPRGALFVDLGIGVALQRLHRYGRAEVGSGPGIAPFDERRLRPGFIWGAPMPDVDVAAGFEF